MTSTQEAGKKGGMKTKLRGSEYYRAIQRKSVVTRRRNKRRLQKSKGVLG